MDAEALRAIADGVRLNLDTVPDAEASAVALQAKLQELDKASNAAPAEVAGEFDVRTDKPILRISRRHHGNIKSSVITQDFVHGADYAALAEAANTFRGLLHEGAKVTPRRGRAAEGRKGQRLPPGHALADRRGRARHRQAALQGPGRDEPAAAVGNDDGPARCAACCACRSTMRSRRIGCSRC